MDGQKLPKNAKRAFKGVIYEVYQWEQEMFDGSTAIFERLKRNDTANVIATIGDKIILLEQEQPFKGKFLSLPGGRGEEGEETITIARREFLEETGCASGELIFWKRFNPVSTMIWSNDYFVARNCERKQEQRLDNGEKIKIKLVSFEEFMLLSENENFRHRDLKPELLRLRLHPEKQENFRKLLFG